MLVHADIGAPSSSSGSSAATAAAAIAQLRDTTETLEKKEEHLFRKIDNEVKQARTFNAAGKKREALTCIKRKKMYEKQLEQISGAKMTLETQRLALENININREALAVCAIEKYVLPVEQKIWVICLPPRGGAPCCAGSKSRCGGTE